MKMKQNKWVVGIIAAIGIFAAVFYFINYNEDRNYIVEKYPEVSHLLFFLEQSKNDTIIVSDFNDLYRRLYLSKINDSIISFCSLYNAKNDGYMFIITPDSISVFEAPDYNANFTMQCLTMDYKGYTNKTNPMFKKIDYELDLIFRQEQIMFYRFIGFIKEKPNRVVFIDNFYDSFSASAFCHTLTIKNNILNPQKWKFLNDRQKRNGFQWRLPFPDNMVPQDSIITRIRRVETYKDSIKRWYLYVE